MAATAVAVVGLIGGRSLVARGEAPTTVFVSERRPALGPGQGADFPVVELSARRPAHLAHEHGPPEQPAGPRGPIVAGWTLLATLPGQAVEDVAFPTPTVGYLAAELGDVWKTTDAGATWTRVLDLSYPYYWYGVDALDANNVVISGFDNANRRGLLRWSHDGGATWSPDVVLTNTGWLLRTRFADPEHGLAHRATVGPPGGPDQVFYTIRGGQTVADWTVVTPDPNGAWFAPQFSRRPNLWAHVAGITYCSSTDVGITWTCHPSVDSVFDGGVHFVSNSAGWVGGGTISPTVSGWVHRTTNGGQTWSGRTLNAAWPIRELRFLDGQRGWAVGGNVFSGVGGIYGTTDGGQTWRLEIDTHAEMRSCTHKQAGARIQIWCVGYRSGVTSFVYTTYRQ